MSIYVIIIQWKYLKTALIGSNAQIKQAWKVLHKNAAF